MTFTAWIVLVVSWWVTEIVLEFRYPCTCGRSRRWYFPRNHAKGWVMWLDVVWIIGFMIASVLSGYAPIGWAIWFVYHVRRAWFHDKDKIRRAAKALGRVVVKDNGRLGVEPS